MENLNVVELKQDELRKIEGGKLEWYWLVVAFVGSFILGGTVAAAVN